MTVTNDNGCINSTTTAIVINGASVVYVNGAVSASGDGSSWSTAFKTVQEALNSCTQQIWVAAGTYKPTAYPAGCTNCSTNRDYTFHLVNGVKMYGGFAGTETLLSQRNYVTNVTILSGDFNGNDSISGSGATLYIGNNTENATHVVLSVNDDSTTVLDGFTIKGGYANGGFSITVETKTISKSIGAGIINITSSPTIANVMLTGNWATNGGGMYNVTYSSPTITNTVFMGNRSTSNGAAIFNSLSSPIITNTEFVGNRASNGSGIYNVSSSFPSITNSIFNANFSTSNGGGVHNSSSSPTIINTIFVGNQALNGGGLYNSSSSSSPTITNSTFSTNSATSNGGGICNLSSSPTIINTIFIGNTASNGGGLYNSSSTSSPTITNSTFSTNSATSDGGAIYNASSLPIIKNTIIWGNTGSGTQGIFSSGGTPNVTYSIIQGAGVYAGTGNSLTDPLFVNAADPNGVDNIWGTADDGLSIQNSSPAINAGTSTGAPVADITGFTRVGNPDMGAYEYSSTNANLNDLTMSIGTLSPIFAADSLSYLATVSNATTGITVTPTAAESGTAIQVQINGGIYTSVVSGNTSTNLALDEGSNVVNVKVTAPNGTTIKTYTITICRSVTPSVSVAIPSGANTICAGTSVTFTATPIHGGTPTYQWKKNGVDISGQTGTTYTSATLAHNDNITVEMTSTATCRTANTAISDAIVMTVNALCNYTWTGTTSTNWTTPTNWSPYGVPTATDDVIIPATANKPVLPSGQIIQNLSLTGANKIMLGNNNLCVNSITGSSSTAYVVIDGTGSLTVKSLSTTTPTLFPVGTSESSYDPLSIEPTNSVNFTVSVKAKTVKADFTGNIADFSKVMPREWNITPTGTAGATVITFIDCGLGLTVTSPKVGHYKSDNTWEELPATYNAGSWTTTTSSFSPYGVGEEGGFTPSTPLPITLLSFKGQNDGVANILNWATSNEQNSHYFDIQHSTNGVDFESVGKIAAVGESNILKKYGFTHQNPTDQTHYYRLKMVDKDGSFKYSLIISISHVANRSAALISFYPNPAKNNISIVTTDYTQAMRLFNASGKLVRTSDFTPDDMDISQLPTGVYFLHVGKDVLKVIKQ